MLETVIRPQRRRSDRAAEIISGSRRRASSKGAITLTDTRLRRSASSVSNTSQYEPIPALTISRSGPNKRAAADSASSPASVARSAGTASTRRAPPSSLLSRSSFSSSRPFKSSAVSGGSDRANASPIPLVAPVTSAARGEEFWSMTDKCAARALCKALVRSGHVEVRETGLFYPRCGVSRESAPASFHQLPGRTRLAHGDKSVAELRRTTGADRAPTTPFLWKWGQCRRLEPRPAESAVLLMFC